MSGVEDVVPELTASVDDGLLDVWLVIRGSDPSSSLWAIAYVGPEAEKSARQSLIGSPDAGRYTGIARVKVPKSVLRDRLTSSDRAINELVEAREANARRAGYAEGLAHRSEALA